MANSILIDVIGYVALTTNLYSMAVKGESKLRIISTIANAIYIIYGVLMEAHPIVIGASIAVILHIYRLYDIKKEITKTKFKTCNT